ncbi:predicted protein [Chaetoceros tenuissimus]|uniref:Uncharacterized protein n=1 Tax=Chaetoceros tenuissimus TaxID=426638 RepID=A0AAD3H3A7_9STRA|nr:predicted protein [Chaetoceros tenuissimus]
MDIEEPSPAAKTNFFATPIVDVDNLTIGDAANGNIRASSLSHKSSNKKRDSLPGTQFKRYSLLNTLKPLPGCKAHESERYKKDNHCSRESHADLDLYGVEDAGELWRILTTIGHTKIDAPQKHNSVPTTQRVKHLLFTLYNYCKTAAARGIYVPYPHLISVDSVMGSEYVSCALTDSIYENYFAMNTPLLEDLRHLFKLNPQISTMLLQHTSGFNAYHIILIQCCQVYRPAPPRSSLCLFDSDSCNAFPSKQLSISAIQKGKPRFVKECRACGSSDHLWAACPLVEIIVSDPTAKKRLLDFIPKGNIRILSTGEDNDLADPTNDDNTTVVDNTSATNDNFGQDSLENNDSFEDEFINDNAAFENVLDEGIITSVEQEYLDDEYDGTI